MVSPHMRQGRAVVPPKASTFMKLPHRPMSWPMNSPWTPRSAKARKLSFRARQKSRSTTAEERMAP